MDYILFRSLPTISLALTAICLLVPLRQLNAQCANGSFTNYTLTTPNGGDGTAGDPAICNFTIEACYDITSFSEGVLGLPRALHGIYLTNLPAGATISAGSTGVQNTSDGLSNNWIFLDPATILEGNDGDGTADFSNTSKITYPGFYVDGATGMAATTNNDPTDNLGDGGNGGLASILGSETFNLAPFCFVITMTSCDPAGSWTPIFNISSDKDTGSRISLASSCSGTAYSPTSIGPNGDGSIYYSSSPLGVEMSIFKGQAEEEENILEWMTISEDNAAWFIIERSSNGRSNFAEVGRLRAKGFSNDPVSYSFSDPYPLPIAYYRLQVVDYDGTYEYSEMIVLQRNNKDYKLARIFPNPVQSNEAYVFYYSPDTSPIIFMLSDQAGNSLMRQQFEPIKGINRIRLDLATFHGKQFLVTIINKKEIITQRLVRQHTY